jgi:FkbH-like protein
MTLTPPLTSLDVLRDRNSTLAATLLAIDSIEASAADWRRVSVGISSNVTVQLLGAFLRKHALLNQTRVVIHEGNHDDLLGDFDRFVDLGTEYAVVIYAFDNLLPSFESQVQRLGDVALDAKCDQVRQQFRLAFEKAKGMKSVFVSRFHRISPVTCISDDRVGQAIAMFNAAVAEEAATYPNVRFIDSDDILREIGRAAAVDFRFYFRGKALFTAVYLNELSRRVMSMSRAFGAVYYKAIVLDCDNSLWGGIIGEDLLSGIKIDPYDFPGNIFWRIQQELVALQQAGVLLCLCSKNNAADVDEVFRSHPHMVLKDDHVILKMVNWNDKPSNIREISKLLNIGLESIIFIDDSEFECSTVRAQLPEVRTCQVPKSLSDYPALLSEIREWCLGSGITEESKAKTEQYRQRARAEGARQAFGSQEEFLASLDLRVEIFRDHLKSTPRISELTQKSNQFNVTTRRYSQSDIETLMVSADVTVYSLLVEDKFGSAGLTGVLIMRWDGAMAVVDSFLMSCRVIGRGVELCIWTQVLADARRHGCKTMRAEYLRTAKNSQVEDFFDRIGMRLVSQSDVRRLYETPIHLIKPAKTSWIEVTNGN